MRKQIWFVGGLLLVGLTWAWLQGADVPDGTISSADYQPGVTAVGTKLLSDLQALETAVNDIDSSNVSETANIQGSKLLNNSIDYTKIQSGDFDLAAMSWLFNENAIEDTVALRIFDHDAFDSIAVDSLFAQGVLQTTDPDQKRVAYGDLWLDFTTQPDTVEAGDSWVQYINFADSSDVGDPGFPAAPSYVDVSRLYLVAAPAYFNQQGDAARRDSLGLLTYEIVSTAAAGCSVHFYWGGHDTIGVAGYKLFWEAKE